MPFRWECLLKGGEVIHPAVLRDNLHPGEAPAVYDGNGIRTIWIFGKTVEVKNSSLRHTGKTTPSLPRVRAVERNVTDILPARGGWGNLQNTVRNCGTSLKNTYLFGLPIRDYNLVDN
jgi:hypothetical protein